MIASVDTRAATHRWAEVWRRAWPAKDLEAIAALYAEDAVYRALAFREPDRGPDGVRRYLKENFDVESDIECWFGEPIVAGERAAVEWWGSWLEDGRPLTLAGVTVLRFDADGRIVDHRDYWNEHGGRTAPYGGW
jgi:ketosteroid isomerase-like protein